MLNSLEGTNSDTVSQFLFCLSNRHWESHYCSPNHDTRSSSRALDREARHNRGVTGPPVASKNQMKILVLISYPR
jgi:hypothetical protein